MTDPTSSRPSSGTIRRDREWNSVIRYLAFVLAIAGLALVLHEIFENVTCHAKECTKIHLGTMMWGLALLSLGLLIIQRGDVSTSLKDFTAAGSIVRGWWERPGRSTDAPGTTVRTEVVKPIELPAPGSDRP